MHAPRRPIAAASIALGRANLAAAFPEKSAEEIEQILRGVWDNLGRVGAEFAHLDQLWDHDPARPGDAAHLLDSDEADRPHAADARRRQAGAGVLGASRQLGAAGGRGQRATGSISTVLFRPPNIGAVADAVIRMRGGIMGKLIPTGLDAPTRGSPTRWQRGSHVAMLVDQYYARGVDGDVLRPAQPGPIR